MNIEEPNLNQTLKQFQNDDHFSIILDKIQDQMNQGKLRPRRNSDEGEQ